MQDNGKAFWKSLEEEVPSLTRDADTEAAQLKVIARVKQTAEALEEHLETEMDERNYQKWICLDKKDNRCLKPEIMAVPVLFPEVTALAQAELKKMVSDEVWSKLIATNIAHNPVVLTIMAVNNSWSSKSLCLPSAIAGKEDELCKRFCAMTADEASGASSGISIDASCFSANYAEAKRSISDVKTLVAKYLVKGEICPATAKKIVYKDLLTILVANNESFRSEEGRIDEQALSIACAACKDFCTELACYNAVDMLTDMIPALLECLNQLPQEERNSTKHKTISEHRQNALQILKALKDCKQIAVVSWRKDDKASASAGQTRPPAEQNLSQAHLARAEDKLKGDAANKRKARNLAKKERAKNAKFWNKHLKQQAQAQYWQFYTGQEPTSAVDNAEVTEETKTPSTPAKAAPPPNPGGKGAGFPFATVMPFPAFNFKGKKGKK